MGTVYPYKQGWRFKYKDGGGSWQTVTTKAETKAQAKAEMKEKELEAERQRLGLVPLSLNPEGWTVADLMAWWLDSYSIHKESHARNVGTVRRHIIESRLASKRLEHVIPGDIEQLLQLKDGDLAPGTVNHVRQFLVIAFNKAKRAGKWFGSNPAEEVETRRVLESVIDILKPEEVLSFFLQLEVDQCVVFAAAISSGLRKGEICGLLKADLDLPRCLLIARHSYERPFPKSKKQRVVRIPEEFVTFYAYALKTYPGRWLFPHRDGTMRDRTWQPEDILRRALKRAGIVAGFSHVCRRKSCRYTEERPDAEVRPCPRCGYKLWPKGITRRIRFHDMRHTYASFLLMLGANLVSVQKLLGHSDPKITERRYGHLLPDFMKSEVDRLRFGLDELAPVLPAMGGELERGSRTSPGVGALGRQFGIPLVSAGPSGKKEAGAPRESRGVPASYVAGCTGLEPVASGVTGRRYNRLN